MEPNRGWVLIDGRLPYWRKSVEGLTDVLRAAGGAQTLDELDEVTEAFAEACESGRLGRVEADLGLRALGRALRRLEGDTGSETPAAEGKANVPRVEHSGGRLEYGAAIPGARVIR